MAAFKKSTMLLVVLALVSMIAIGTDAVLIRVRACDETCDRIRREQNTCCRNHGTLYSAGCRRGRILCESG